MRILQLGPYPPPYGGVQTNLVAIRSYLRKQGVLCSVINVTRHRKPQADDVYYPSSAVELLQLLARLQFDIIHQHLGGMLTHRILGLSLACTLRPGVKSVMTFHSGGFPSTPEGRTLGPNSLAAFILRRFDGLIAVNPEIVNFFQRLRIQPDRVRLISPYAFLDDHDSFPDVLGRFFAEHDPVLISAGQLEPEYDLPLQIDAIAELRRKFARLGLVLLGSGSLERDLHEKIVVRQCQEHILLPGDVAHGATIEAIARSRLMLRTTWYDGDAISVREAMQVGTPVIATETALRPAGIRLIPKSNLPALLRAIEDELQRPLARGEHTQPDESSVRKVFDFYRDLLGEANT